MIFSTQTKRNLMYAAVAVGVMSIAYFAMSYTVPSMDGMYDRFGEQAKGAVHDENFQAYKATCQPGECLSHDEFIATQREPHNAIVNQLNACETKECEAAIYEANSGFLEDHNKFFSKVDDNLSNYHTDLHLEAFDTACLFGAAAGVGAMLGGEQAIREQSQTVEVEPVEDSSDSVEVDLEAQAKAEAKEIEEQLLADVARTVAEQVRLEIEAEVIAEVLAEAQAKAKREELLQKVSEAVAREEMLRLEAEVALLAEKNALESECKDLEKDISEIEARNHAKAKREEILTNLAIAAVNVARLEAERAAIVSELEKRAAQAAADEEASRLECNCANQACKDCESSQAKHDHLKIQLAESAARVAALEAAHSSVAEDLAAHKTAEEERLRLESEAARKALEAAQQKLTKTRARPSFLKLALCILFFVFKMSLLAFILFAIGWYLMAAIHECTQKKQVKPAAPRRNTKVKFAFSGIDLPESEDLEVDLESGRNTLEKVEIEHKTIEV